LDSLLDPLAHGIGSVGDAKEEEQHGEGKKHYYWAESEVCNHARTQQNHAAVVTYSSYCSQLRWVEDLLFLSADLLECFMKELGLRFVPFPDF